MDFDYSLIRHFMKIVSKDNTPDGKIHKSLVEAWAGFVMEEQTHPDHVRLFRDGIHACQQVLMWRELQRDKPEKYPVV